MLSFDLIGGEVRVTCVCVLCVCCVFCVSCFFVRNEKCFFG